MNYSKIIIFISLFFFSFFINERCYPQSGWYQINSPTNNNLRGIYFKNANTGIISGYKTTNGGQTWLNKGPNNPVWGLSFPDTAIGYCCTELNVYKTSNFGDNWVLQQSPTAGFSNIYFINLYTGYACGNNIIKTTNGGTNWYLINNNLPNPSYFQNLFFVNSETGFVLGIKDSCYVIKTSDGGQNWDIKYFNGQSFYSIFFVNQNTGFIGGTNIFRTTNFGLNWNQYSYNTLPLLSIYFTSPNTGYGCYANGDIIKTTDGGNQWFREYPVTGYQLNSIFFVNENTGYVCGFNGTILKTTNGGGPPIGVKPIGTAVPDNFSLSQNYPNPFNPVTNINYEIPTAGFVKLVVYDILGREIKTLVNEKQSTGKYQVDFDGTGLPGGVYFYRLIADGAVIDTKKLVLLK